MKDLVSRGNELRSLRKNSYFQVIANLLYIYSKSVPATVSDKDRLSYLVAEF